MKRILVLCQRDWLNPRAGAVEHYLREVCTRIVAQGHYVAWVAHHFRNPGYDMPKRSRMEFVDGVHIARLGHRIFYRKMVGLVLQRMIESGKLTAKFDCIMDCIDGVACSPITVDETPVIPVVFDISKRLRPSAEPPGPMIAATSRAHRLLTQTGVPERFIIRAPFGVDHAVFTPGEERRATPTIVGMCAHPAPLVKAIKKLQRHSTDVALDLIAPAPPRTTLPFITHHLRPTPEARCTLYRRAWVGCCAHGYEDEALAMAAAGLPVVCADTAPGRDTVVDGETGLLYPAGDRRALTECLDRLVHDEVLHKRLSTNALENATRSSWDRTAGLVLATIENL